MSRISKLTLAFAVLVVFGLGAPAAKADECTVAGNLVVNCGFETGTFSSWTQSGNTGSSGVDSLAIDVHSGSFGAFFGPIGTLGFITQNLATTAGSTYNLSFWLRNDGGLGTEWLVRFNGVSLLDVSNASAFQYTLFTFNGLLATGSSTPLQFGFRQDPFFWSLDDIIVTQAQGPAVPEPMTLVLLGTGLAGVATKLRRRKVA